MAAADIASAGVQFAPWRMFAPVYLITLLYAGFSFPAAALLAVLLPSMVFELSLTWRTALVVIVVSAVSLRVAKEPGATMAAKFLRDMARSKLGTLVYRSPLGDLLNLTAEASPLDPLPPDVPNYVQVVRTSKEGGERLKVLQSLALQDQIAPPGSSKIILEPSVRFQTFLGFGGSFTESSAELLQKMKPNQQEQVIEAYFSQEKGIAYSWGRVHMGACDFSRGNWSCVEQENDKELKSFSIERYRTAMLPMIKRAQEVASRPLQLIASPWSPPAWMKDTGRMQGGGALKDEFKSAWAQHYVLFAQALKEEGAPLWGFTVQNEPHATTPWENCLYNGDMERDFVKDHLGPALEASGLDLKLLVWDHNRDEMFARAHTIYSDPEAAKYIWGIGYHWYGDPRYEFWPAREGMTLFDNVRKVHELRPDKHIIMTEACQEAGPRIGDWQLGERYAEAIIKDLEAWLEAWIDWNLILDERGGPNHVQNLVSAPVIFDTERGKLLYLSSFYYIGQFSRYIKPGAQRISTSSSRDKLEATGFVNPDGSVVAVVLNQEDYEIGFWLQVAGRSVETQAPPRSITTYVIPKIADPPPTWMVDETAEEQ